MKYTLLAIFAFLAVRSYSQETETPTFVQTSVQDHVVSEKDPNDNIGRGGRTSGTQATILVQGYRDPDHQECTECNKPYTAAGVDLSKDKDPSSTPRSLLKADRNTPVKVKTGGSSTQDDGDGQH